MNVKKGLWLCFVSFMSFILVACSQDAQPYSDNEEQLLQQQINGMSESHVKLRTHVHKQTHSPSDVTSESSPVSDETPPLVGGSETTQRPHAPASNQMLQQKFPSTVMLRGPTDTNYVALTFDDGPDRRFTPQVLDVLKKHGVKATFFLMGSRVENLPSITRRIDREGHAIGNHTYWHPKLYAESLARSRWEITATDQLIEETLGYRTTLFRAPYGGLTEALVEQMADMGLSVIGWSVDSLDWKGISKEEVEQNVLSTAGPGSIILMHSGGHWTQDLSGMVAALDTIIPKLKQQGLQFVTIPEMLNIKDKV